MDKIATAIPGCFELRPRIFSDARGTFVKTFHRDTFRDFGLASDFPEQFYSVSRKGVLRGLHFQIPPAAQAKLVTCVSGKILDAIVDLRTTSPTFGRHVLLELSAESATMAYLPIGMAHGFYTLSESATILYNASSVYAPAHDAGIRWDTAGIPWPDTAPIVSDRDQGFPALKDLRSPFTEPLAL